MKIMIQGLFYYIKTIFASFVKGSFRSLRGAFVKGRFHNRSSAEPIRRGAFVKGSFVQGGGGVYDSY